MPNAKLSYFLKNKKTLICQECKRNFSASGKRADAAKFCSRSCYLKNRGHSSGRCLQCGKSAKGLRFCNPVCQRTYWNERDEVFRAVRRKSRWKQKAKLLQNLGGKCLSCGITDIRVLDIDHIDASKKTKPDLKRYPSYIRFNLGARGQVSRQPAVRAGHQPKARPVPWKTDGMF